MSSYFLRQCSCWRDINKDKKLPGFMLIINKLLIDMCDVFWTVSALFCRTPTPSSPLIRSADSWSTTWLRTPSGWGRACPDGNPRPGKSSCPDVRCAVNLQRAALCSWHWSRTALATGWPDGDAPWLPRLPQPSINHLFFLSARVRVVDVCRRQPLCIFKKRHSNMFFFHVQAEESRVHMWLHSSPRERELLLMCRWWVKNQLVYNSVFLCVCVELILFTRTNRIS